MTDRPDDAADADGVLDWADLPDAVRAAVIDVAARAVAAVDPRQLPATLRQVAHFTPAKRARRGAVPLGRALDEDAGFRALVASRLPPEFGADPGDPVKASARAFLTRRPGSADLLAAARRDDTVAVLRNRVAELSATVELLTGKLAAAAAEPVTPDTGPDDLAAQHRAEAEIDKLRVRLRHQGTALRQARDQADQRVAAAESAVADAVAHLERERGQTAAWQQKAEQEAHRADLAQQALALSRDQATQARLDVDRRMALLLDTVIDAATGLRREWRLAGGGADPADVVARGFAAPGSRQRRPADAALLLEWLTLPGAHLIVDGYNVTKSGYGELPLAEQRDRLTRSLSALAARTGAEVTVVFDGAAVVVPASSPRGVRVVFSPPGVIADDVIRRMAAAEPAGRVVVVVSSDREIVDAVRRSGARVAESPVLLTTVGGA